MSSINYPKPKTLAIGLGGNVPSHIGSPQKTLITARPLIEKAINNWINECHSENPKDFSNCSEIIFRWSSLYKTKPLGGPKEQPNFVNSVLIVYGGNLSKVNPSYKAAKSLLKRFLSIEEDLDRDRKKTNVRWGPRSIDIDFLAWGDLQIKTSELTLPHPYLIERDFVIIPLAQAMKGMSSKPVKISPQKGWAE